MRRLALVAALAATYALGAPAFAEEEPAAEPHATGAEHAEPEHEAGLQNWWSWDYGASAKEPSHRGLPPPYGWAIVNFLVFGAILSRILWRPLKQGFVERHRQIKDELDEATRLRQAAAAQLDEYQKKVAYAEQEVTTLLTQIRAEAEADRARIVAAAEAEAVRLRAEADRQIQVEIERARTELRKEAVEAALKAAQEILRRGVTAEDQHRLAERYVADLDGAAGKPRGAA